MDYVITILLVIGTIGFFFGMARRQSLLSTNEVNSLNLFSSENLSAHAQSLKSQAIYGFSIFLVSVFGMFVLVGTSGPL